MFELGLHCRGHVSSAVNGVNALLVVLLVVLRTETCQENGRRMRICGTQVQATCRAFKRGVATTLHQGLL